MRCSSRETPHGARGEMRRKDLEISLYLEGVMDAPGIGAPRPHGRAQTLG